MSTFFIKNSLNGNPVSLFWGYTVLRMNICVWWTMLTLHLPFLLSFYLFFELIFVYDTPCLHFICLSFLVFICSVSWVYRETIEHLSRQMLLLGCRTQRFIKADSKDIEHNFMFIEAALSTISGGQKVLYPTTCWCPIRICHYKSKVGNIHKSPNYWHNCSVLTFDFIIVCTHPNHSIFFLPAACTFIYLTYLIS